MVSPNRSKVTIKDVARACGVSTQTISRVLNDRADVSPATREKVLAVMQQMEYQPSALARSMRQRSTTLGVIIAGLNYVGISTTLFGITQASQGYGFSLLLKVLPTFDSPDMQTFIQSLSAHRVEGIIYAAPEVGDNWRTVQKFLNDQMPPVVYRKGNPPSAPPTISFDNFAGAYAITNHLIEQGYTRIAHIAGPLDWWESRERKRGWMRALLDADLPAPESAVISGDWSTASGAASLDTLLAQYPEMDAVFAANDQTALGVLSAATVKGIRVPHSLGVAGYDDIAEAEYLTPPLTTMHQDFNLLGELAVHKLMGMNDPTTEDPSLSGNTIILPTPLKVRQSTQRG